MANQIIISVDYEQLLKDVKLIVINALPTSVEQTNISTENDLISREETAKLLGVCLGSIHNYTKKGPLKKYNICGKVLYKKSEVLKALNKK